MSEVLAAWIDGELREGEPARAQSGRLAPDAAPARSARLGNGEVDDKLDTPVVHGVFETLAARRHEYPTWPRHRSRLAWAAARLACSPVPAIDFCAVFDEVFDAAGLDEGRLRVSLRPRASTPRLVIELRALDDRDARRAKGVELDVVSLDDFEACRRRELTPADALELACKSERRAHWDELARRANARGFDDVLVLGAHGELRETSRANIFVIDRDGALVTPTLVDAFLPGIARELLLEELRREGASVRERTLLHSEAPTWRECFVTNAVQGVVPVRAIASETFAPGEGAAPCTRGAPSRRRPRLSALEAALRANAKPRDRFRPRICTQSGHEARIRRSPDPWFARRKRRLAKSLGLGAFGLMALRGRYKGQRPLRMDGACPAGG